MPQVPREFATELLAEARETHPWLHHRLFRMICDGELSRDQVRNVVREQGAFFLDTLRHAAWKIISVGGFTPSFEDLERQRALIPLVVEEGGHDTIGGKQTAHAYLFVRLCEGLGWTRDDVFATAYLPTTIIEKNELFQLQREGTLEALCGGNIATESINHIVSAHGRGHGEALRRPARQSRLLLRAHGSGGRPRRARDPDPRADRAHRRGAGPRPPRVAPRDHRTPPLRRRNV